MKHLLLLLLMVINTGFARQGLSFLQVRDLWTGKPLPQAELKIGQLIWRVNQSGMLALDSLTLTADQSLIVTAPGYFPETIPLNAITRNPLIYLTPVEQTTFITVSGDRAYPSPLSMPAHRSVITFEGLPTPQELAQQLNLQSGLFLKSYGAPSSLQTISLRGMSAEQTQVLLDGIPLNNLQLGSSDLSLLEGADIQAIEIYRGSNAILGGSGAIGGSLNLRSTEPGEAIRLHIASGWNSLKNKRLSAQLHWPFRNSRNVITFSHANGLNRYSTRALNHNVALRNRDFRQNFVSWKSVFRPARDWKFSLRLAQFKKAAGAPAPFTNASSEAANRARITLDNTLVHSSLRYQSNPLELFFSTYFRNEWMTYSDPVLIINHQALHSVHFNQEKGLQGRFHYSPRQTLLIKGGVELAEQKISSSNAGQHRRSRASFYLLGDGRLFEKRFSLQAFHLNAGLRLEKFGHETLLWLPSAGVTFSWPAVQLFATLGKNFRAPTFNDLYWSPGGNSDLKPEKSLNAESGLRFYKIWGSWITQNEVTLFQNLVSNQIKWLPSQSGLWQPLNIAGVLSRGLEIDLALSDLKDRFKLMVNYHYIQTVKNKAEYPGDPTVGHQLPLLPREKLAISLQWRPNNFRLTLNGQKVSFRYLDFSNQNHQILPGYLESTLALGYRFSFKTFSIQSDVQIENLFNQHYTILPGYPLPGRYFGFSLQFLFHHQNNGGN